ncbi:hypothetical protein BHE74_00013651 [Ensete ventricosum]|nr:hypothetical protein BHE74_00013651 [Ensete ventricosum]
MGGTYRSVRSSVRGSPATGRFRQKLIVGDRLREKKGRRRRGKEEKKKRGVPISMRHPRRRCVPSLPTDRQRPRAVAARGSQALFLLRGERSRRCRRHWRPIAARRSRVLFLPREEMERLPTWGERSRRQKLSPCPSYSRPALMGMGGGKDGFMAACPARNPGRLA